MLVEIWDRTTANGEEVVMVSIGGTGTQHANHEAAFEYLGGYVREIKSAIETAEVMYLRNAQEQERSEERAESPDSVG
jgi:hypothetical protein